MYHLPEHFQNLSLGLSEVLDEIGVNERTVKKWRRSALLQETALSLSYGINCNIFGSRSEGTTTIGIDSDADLLICFPHYNLIQDYSEWKPGLINLLMIQGDITSQGYCHLQLVRHDMPLPVTDILNKHCFQDASGRILLKNTAFDIGHSVGFKNGPAMTYKGQPGVCASDCVVAVSCESWPYEARGWSQRCLGIWPTEDMKRYVENSGCFVVPVGSKVSQLEYLEWRISTSKAERCLMYNLNITQIRCFVLLKMILKTYLQHPVSSYMCKTVLLRCIEKTHYNMWQENNLLTCLTVCLQALHISVLYKSCPHYFIPGNNLMARQFSPTVKDKLLKSLHHILESQGAALYGIKIDDLGERLQNKMNPLYQSVQSAHLSLVNDNSRSIAGSVIFTLAKHLIYWQRYLRGAINNHITGYISRTTVVELLQAILNFFTLYKNGTNTERKVLQLLVPFYCSSLGSELASVNIGTNRSVSPEALRLLSAGLHSDVSSGRLKLASVLYCAGDMLEAEAILTETERLYHLDSVEPVCNCFDFARTGLKKEYCRVCDTQNEKAIKCACAHCVIFFPNEMNCIPRELQYEQYRSTEEERLQRDDISNSWMDMAVVDSLPFLFFLQYKTYGYLQNYNDQQRALKCLESTINSDEQFTHRETTLNLLGQCMEQENRLNDALVCYTRSLNVRGTNNAARYHLCILLADMQNNLH